MKAHWLAITACLIFNACIIVLVGAHYWEWKYWETLGLVLAFQAIYGFIQYYAGYKGQK